MSGGWAEAAPRPGRRTYRAQRSPSVQVFEDTDDDPGLVVLRTHDLDVATYLAADWWAGLTGGPLPPAIIGWTKLVPWGRWGESGAMTWLTLGPNDRGAVPCVWFSESDTGAYLPGLSCTALRLSHTALVSSDLWSSGLVIGRGRQVAWAWDAMAVPE